VASLIEVYRRLAAEEVRATELLRQNQGSAGAVFRKSRSFQRYSTYHRPTPWLSHADCVVRYY